METPDKPSGSLLDPDQIKMLIEAGASDSLELFNEILALFEEESRSKFKELHAGMEAGNFDSVGRAAHALAGSSANIGGREVWLRARDIENLCKSGNGPEAVELIPALELTFQETMIQLKHFVAQLESPAD